MDVIQLLRRICKIKHLFLVYTKTVDSVFRALLLTTQSVNILHYYMEESVLLGTKPLVDSIRQFIRDPSGVFSVCHLCECRIVQ